MWKGGEDVGGGEKAGDVVVMSVMMSSDPDWIQDWRWIKRKRSQQIAWIWEVDVDGV